MLNQINNNKEIQDYLYTRPFTIKNIQIIIYNHDKNGKEVYDPDISGVQISQGILSFRTVDKENVFKFKSHLEESYEEALKALQN